MRVEKGAMVRQASEAVQTTEEIFIVGGLFPATP